MSSGPESATESPTGATDPSTAPAARAHDHDGLTLRWWFVGYAAWLVACIATLGFLLDGEDLSWQRWVAQPEAAFRAISPAAKLVACAGYLSICTTFLPLAAGWVIAALASREAAVAGSLVPVVLLVTTAGAIGSTVANVADYHLLTLMFRHPRIQAVRSSRFYERVSQWFGGAPFTILVVGNIVPIPLDVVRVLAVAVRYPRLPYTAGNFLGRFIRYALIAFATYYWDLGWVAAVALLILATVLALARFLPAALKAIFGGKA